MHNNKNADKVYICKFCRNMRNSGKVEPSSVDKG